MTAPVITLASLAPLPQWVAWKIVMRPGKGGKLVPTKVPVNPKTGRLAKSNGSTTWATRDEADKRAKADNLAGVGLILGPLPTADVVVCGVDLDTCRDPVTGAIEPWAQAVIDRFCTYTEVSPSKTGDKLFFTIAAADLPAVETIFGGAEKYGLTFKRANGVGGDEHPPGIEVYRNGRYFAVTDNKVGETDVLRSVDVAELKWLIEDHGPEFVGQGKKTSGSANDALGAGAQPNVDPRLAKAFATAAALKAKGMSFDDVRDALIGHADPDIVAWVYEVGLQGKDEDGLHAAYDGTSFAGKNAAADVDADEDVASDKTRSAKAFRAGARLKGAGATYEEMRDALLGHANSDIRDWANSKGRVHNERELHKIYDKARAARPRREPPSWLQTCERDDRDRIIPNLANLMIALRLDPALVDAFAFDQMLHAPVLKHELPAAPNGKTTNGIDPVPRPLRDADVSDLREYVQHNGFPRIANDISHEAINKRARELSFHPIRNWLSTLVWDGTPRLDGWLVTYLGASGDHAYLAAVGEMFLIAMVARVFRPGCKVDYMLVLEGEQGAAKSQACAILAGQWFSDALPDIHHKDAALHHRGKWLIEISELSAFTRADIEVLKAFITRDTERYRPPYGKLEVIEPRQSAFIGTTNRATYLKDETGGRRFWPFLVGVILLDDLRRDRDQLFAEAVMRFRRGDHWWPEAAFEAETIRAEQEKRREEDPWEGPIAEYLSGKALGVSAVTKVNIKDIAVLALGFDTMARVGTADQRRITAVLKILHWEPGGRDMHARYYVRKK